MTDNLKSKLRFENQTVKSLNEFINEYLDKKWYWITSLDFEKCQPFDRLTIQGYADFEQNDLKVQFFGNGKGTVKYLTKHDFKIVQKKLAQIEKAKQEILS